MAEEYWARLGNGETFSRGPFATRAEVVEKMQQEISPGRVFFVGKAEPVDVARYVPSADDIMERMSALAYNHCGECAEGWPDSTDEQECELTDALRTVVVAWVTKHGLQPKFFAVVDIREHGVRD